MTLAQLENVHAYYEMLYLGEGEESCDVENLSEAHPLRVVSLYKNLKRLDKASALFFGEKFSGKDLEILMLTTGKLSVTEIAEKVGATVPDVIDVLNRLEKNFLIVYTRN